MSLMPICEVTIVDTLGSSPAKAGARMTVSQKGLESGTVGGGQIEQKAIEMAQKLVSEKKHTLFKEWNLKTDLGMSCGGLVRVYFEVRGNDLLNLNLFGAGHISQALSYHLQPLKFQVQCFDVRKEWLDKLPMTFQKINLNDWAQLDLSMVHLSSYCVVFTPNADCDLTVLRQLLRLDLPYVGVIGSHSKSKKIKASLLEGEFSPQKVDSIRCPMGLPFGSNDPHEIALSIVSEIMTVRDSKNKFMQTSES